MDDKVYRCNDCGKYLYSTAHKTQHERATGHKDIDLITTMNPLYPPKPDKDGGNGHHE